MLLVAMLLPPLVCAEDKVATTPPIKVQVQVDAQGHLGDITPMQKLDEPYASLVQRTLAGWSFYPARVQGKPVITTTWLTIELKAQPRGNGDFDVQVVYLGNGPRFEMLNPAYPGSMVRERTEAKITVLATIEADGSVADVHFGQALTTDGVSAKDFEINAIAAVKKAKVHSIIVDGEPVATHLSIPIQFALGARTIPMDLKPAKGSSKSLVAEKDALPGDTMVALDSPVSPRSTPEG
ncbi:hypothetical protein B0E48_12570 [Rhodanobacter sp. C03]|nr:hypothetical protein B0E48_12570 [Rhodanobacter sp. C03]